MTSVQIPSEQDTFAATIDLQEQIIFNISRQFWQRSEALQALAPLMILVQQLHSQIVDQLFQSKAQLIADEPIHSSLWQAYPPLAQKLLELCHQLPRELYDGIAAIRTYLEVEEWLCRLNQINALTQLLLQNAEHLHLGSTFPNNKPNTDGISQMPQDSLSH